MNGRNWRFLAILALALSLIAAACGGDDDEATETTASGGTETTDAAPSDGDPLKVAFVHVGPVADKGWSWAHDQGMKYLEDNLNVETTFLAEPEPDAELRQKR